MVGGACLHEYKQKLWATKKETYFIKLDWASSMLFFVASIDIQIKVLNQTLTLTPALTQTIIRALFLIVVLNLNICFNLEPKGKNRRQNILFNDTLDTLASIQCFIIFIRKFRKYDCSV